MAKAKASAKKSTKTKAAAKSAKAPARSSKAPAPPKDLHTIGEAEKMLMLWPPLSDVQREAFRAQFADDRCERYGAQTQSAAVHKEALAFAHVIDSTLRKHGRELRRYGAARFAWFLECIVALSRARTEMAAGKDDGVPARNALDAAVGKAKDVRRELIHALEMLVGDHPSDRAELDSAALAGDKPEVLTESLSELAKIADHWLRRTDGESKALVASVDLRQGDVDLAWAASQQLEAANDRAAGRTRGTGKDTTPVNRAEGRVLLEMRQAMHAFGHANASAREIPKLVPGPGTRHVLASHPSSHPSSKAAAKSAVKNGKEAGATAPPN